jgi:hypothetical protein
MQHLTPRYAARTEENIMTEQTPVSRGERLIKRMHKMLGETADEIRRLREENEVLWETLRIYMYAYQSGNDVPPHIEARAKKIPAPNSR